MLRNNIVSETYTSIKNNYGGMESDETSTKSQGNGFSTMLLPNIKSAKGKAADLQSPSTDFNIICLTSHLDCSI